MSINFFFEKNLPFTFDEEILKTWLSFVAKRHDKQITVLNYRFCDDEEILRINRQFLNHDYFTDIITFDYSHDKNVGGDIFISLDTVESNSKEFGTDFKEEFLRVLVHGLLHLCGINDKGEGEREKMEKEENKALFIYKELTDNEI